MGEARALLWTFGVVAAVFCAGACSLPVLRLPRRPRTALLLLLAIATFLAPLLVPLPWTSLRFIVSLASIAVGVKLYDLWHTAQTGPLPDGWAFLSYLTNDCNLVYRRGTAAKPGSSRQTDALRLCWLAAATIACILATLAIWQLDWPSYPWVFEHAAKVIAVCACLGFGLNIGASARRLMGIPATDFFGWFFASDTPAEFWRRWNKPAGQFLNDYLFIPAGGRRHIWRATVATFALNGLVHEYVFGIACGRPLGWAFLFFVVQGLATAATMRLRPEGPVKALGILLTIIFNLASSTLIFACVNAVVPFYAARGN